MFFNPAVDEADDTINANGMDSADDANDLSFGSKRELNALRQKQGDAAALQLFKRIRNLEEEQQQLFLFSDNSCIEGTTFQFGPKVHIM